ncbi:MAG: hypothetical protein WKF79_11770 [Nocardioides sp.]
MSTVTLRTRSLTAGGALLLAASLSACGGGSSAPDDASKEEFCAAYTDTGDGLQDLDPEASPEEQAKVLIEALQQQVESLEEVGTPEDMPDDAREGFEITLEVVGDLEEDEIAKAIEEQDEDFGDISDSDKEKTDALEEYVGENCEIPELEVPTE